tara:strand:+ start:267 stop:389 length:123 start_codon:yes stop_codon:yes gene_type:complete
MIGNPFFARLPEPGDTRQEAVDNALLLLRGMVPSREAKDV